MRMDLLEMSFFSASIWQGACVGKRVKRHTVPEQYHTTIVIHHKVSSIYRPLQLTRWESGCWIITTENTFCYFKFQRIDWSISACDVSIRSISFYPLTYSQYLWSCYTNWSAKHVEFIAKMIRNHTHINLLGGLSWINAYIHRLQSKAKQCRFLGNVRPWYSLCRNLV